MMNHKYYDLGSFYRSVSTSSNVAQTWFDRGLVWAYGFNHEEAARCFEKAIHHDRQCAMGHWGLALVLGPNYNKPWHVFDECEKSEAVSRTRHAVSEAEAASYASPIEKALIKALRSRYPSDSSCSDYSLWNQNYADAMGCVYRAFPGDLDIATLYADSLMNLTPWELWDIKSGQPALGSRTLEIKAVLDQELARKDACNHPGLLHLYIHLMEMSPTPEKALTVADHLRGLVPDAGHLNHMPTHIDILCGDYRRAIASNSDAIRADEIFLTRQGPVNFYTLYRSHNYHFRIYAAMFAGQLGVALDTAQSLEATIPPELLHVQSPPMADWLEAFLSIRVHILVRFGRWTDLIHLVFPLDRALYCVTTATIYYGKGVAFAATGRLQEAEYERMALHDAIDNVPPSRRLFNNICVDVLQIARSMLDGELEYRRGNVRLAFDHLCQAINLEDSLPYDEPWGWMQPVRHVYGALLLEQGHVHEALKAYAADLGLDNTLPRALQHPNNVWALHDYRECLARLGKQNEARILLQQFKLVAATADVGISSSCFCRGSNRVNAKCCM